MSINGVRFNGTRQGGKSWESYGAFERNEDVA